MVSDVIADNDCAVEMSRAPAVFNLRINGNESLTAVCTSIGNLCASIEDYGQDSVAVVQIEDFQAAASWPGDITVQDANRWERAIRRLEHCSAIVITTTRGECSGATLDFLLVSDYRIAAPDLNLHFPINIGQFWPSMGIHRLVQQVGLVRARQIVLWQPSMAAEPCLLAGLVDELDEDLRAATVRMISRINGKKGSELAIRRRLLLEALSSPYEEALGTHLAACDRELRRMREADLT